MKRNVSPFDVQRCRKGCRKISNVKELTAASFFFIHYYFHLFNAKSNVQLKTNKPLTLTCVAQMVSNIARGTD